MPQQAATYAAQMQQQMSAQFVGGYESAYQPAAVPGGPDVGSIPLPPTNPPLPAAPQPQPPPENNFYMNSVNTNAAPVGIYDMPSLDYDYTHPNIQNSNPNSVSTEPEPPKNPMLYSSNPPPNQFSSQQPPHHLSSNTSPTNSTRYQNNNTEVTPHNTTTSSDMSNMSGSSDHHGAGNSSTSSYMDPMEMFASALASRRNSNQSIQSVNTNQSSNNVEPTYQPQNSYSDNIFVQHQNNAPSYGGYDAPDSKFRAFRVLSAWFVLLNII